MMHIYGVTLYECGYICRILRPKQLPEDVIEKVNTQNSYNHIIGLEASLH